MDVVRPCLFQGLISQLPGRWGAPNHSYPRKASHWLTVMHWPVLLTIHGSIRTTALEHSKVGNNTPRAALRTSISSDPENALHSCRAFIPTSRTRISNVVLFSYLRRRHLPPQS